MYKEGVLMYVLAIDGGGTKTVGLISDQHGQIYAKSVVKSSNPTAISQSQFEARIGELLEHLLHQNAEVFNEIHICFAGMAGVNEKSYEPILEKVIRRYVSRTTEVIIENDALIALYSGTLGAEGIVQIAGTGAITLGLDHRQIFSRTGGWGYLFDDEGSGYYLGVAALGAVFKAFDGRSPKTLLTEFVIHYFDVQQVPQLIDCIYSTKHPRALISPLSSLVVEAARKGDEVAEGILDTACQKIYVAIKACFKKMEWRNESIPVILVGGVFSEADLFISRLTFLAKSEGSPFTFSRPLISPVGGAVIGGLRRCGMEVDEQFIINFSKNE